MTQLINYDMVNVMQVFESNKHSPLAKLELLTLLFLCSISTNELCFCVTVVPYVVVVPYRFLPVFNYFSRCQFISQNGTPPSNPQTQDFDYY